MRPDRSSLRRGAGATLALLLVATAMLNPLGLAALDRSSPVGSAEAQNLGACGVSVFIEGASTLGGGDTDIPHACLWTPTNEAEIEEDWLGIYTTIDQAGTTGESYRTVYHNSIESSNETALMIAESTSLNATINGDAKIRVKNKSRNAVLDFYSRMQFNFANRWNTQIATVQAAYARNETVPGDVLDISMRKYQGTDVHTEFEIHSFGNETVSLVNGTNVQTRTIKTVGAAHNGGGSVDINDPADVGDDSTFGITDERKDLIDGDPTSGINIVLSLNSIWARSPPDTSYLNSESVNPQFWAKNWQRTEAYAESAVNRSDSLVETLYPEIEAGNINASEYLSRITLMEKYSVDSAENFNDILAALMAQGFQPPEGSTAYMNLTYERLHAENLTTRDGLLLSQNAPNGSWQTGVWYNSTNIDGAQMVATLSGQSHSIDGNFTINAAYDSGGDKIQNPDLNIPERDYRTFNTTELNNRIDRLGDRVADLQNQTRYGGGGGFGIGWKYTGLPNILPNIPVTAILVGAGVLVLLFVVSLFKP